MGIKTTADGVDGLLPHLKADGVQIVFDATSAYVHAANSRKVNALGAMMIDLTPAAIGPFCVPPVNLRQHVGKREMNVNMVTCGGQATIPMVFAVSRVQPVAYGEIVATVSKPLGGPARARTSTSSRAPPPDDRESRRREAGQGDHHHQPGRSAADHARHGALPDGDRSRPGRDHRSIHAMIAEVQKYVPGYKLVNGPVFDGRRVASSSGRRPRGLPAQYAGNLDIMTAAAAPRRCSPRRSAGSLTLEPVAAWRRNNRTT